MGSDFNSYTCQSWADLGASYSLADDRSSTIWSDFGNGAVPRNVIIDSEGLVRYSAIGYNETAVSSLLDELLSAVGVDDTEQQPDVHQVISNYPNPFNAGTRIKFQLPQSGVMSLTIHNARGQRVRTLLNNSLEAGSHTVEWNTLDDKGVDLPSGIYMAILQTNNFQESQKLLLLK